MKKRLNVDSVANELRGGSAFFPNYRESASTVPKVETPPSLPQEITPEPASRPVMGAPAADRKTTKPRFHGTVEPRNHGTVVSPGVAETRSAQAENILDISAKADIKHTFEFTNAELELLEDIKLELRREADLRVAKNDIVRLGIHVLAEDYRQKKASSIIATTLGKKK